MISRILNLIRKELIQFRRDRLLTPFIIFGPVLQMMMLASATATEMTHLQIAVLDQDQSSVSRSLITAFGNSSQLDSPLALDSIKQGQFLIDDGKVDMMVIIPPSFSTDIATAGRRPQVQVIIDGSNSFVALTLTQIAQGVLAHFQGELLAEMGVGDTAIDGVEMRSVAYYNPELNLRHSALPAQLGLIVYMVTMLVASLGITRERERGTMEQLIIMPISRIELMIGKALPVLVISLIDFIIMHTIATRVYGVPMWGDFTLLLGLTALYVMVEMGMGLIVSSVARSQQQALQLIFLIGVTNVAFSGYMVPVENMPWLLSKLSYLFPIQHYMTILKGVMLKGAGLADIMNDVLALLGLGAVISTTAYLVLQRRLD